MNGGTRVDDIFRELAALQQQDPACADLLQFRRRITARQYGRLYDLVRRYVPSGAAVLDWGCGNGHASFGLQRLGFNVTGFSFEELGLRRHLEGYKFERGSQGEPARLPFANAAFEAVLSVGVLEHVRETGGSEEASLREIARVLAPGGVFICYHLPNRYSAIEAVTRNFFPGRYSHPHRYDGADIERMCEVAGLQLLERRRYGVVPRNFWAALPGWIGDSQLLCGAWDAVDTALGRVLGVLAQNHWFVARKGNT